LWWAEIGEEVEVKDLEGKYKELEGKYKESLEVMKQMVAKSREIMKRMEKDKIDNDKIIMKKIIMSAYCVAIAFVCVYVPWKQSLQSIRLSIGYSLIWSPPNMSSVDIERVIVEIIGISALGGLAFYLSGGFK